MEQRSLFEIAQDLLGPPIVTQTLVDLDKEILPLPEAKESVEAESVENGKNIATQDTTTIDAVAAPDLPIDVEGTTCTAIIVVPYDHLAHLLMKLRHNFFSTMEGKLSRRYERGEELT